jgi:hypothetical protein
MTDVLLDDDDDDDDVSCHECSSFKLFLELEPQLREIVYKLHDSKYASSLKLLDEMKVSYANACQCLSLLQLVICIIRECARDTLIR